MTRLSLMARAIVFSALVGSSVLVAQTKELGHDDGKQDNRRSTAGSGHAVAFVRPGDTFAVSEVRVHGSRYGGRYDPFLTVARVSVCDGDMRPLAQAFVDYSAWKTGRADWVDVAVGPVLVPERFYALVEFFPTQTKGVYMSIDESAGGHSYSASVGKLGTRLSNGGWMIRVVGSTKIPVVEVADESDSVVLANGSGEAVGKQSIAGSGHAVRFKPSSKRRFLTGISIAGGRYGGGYNADRTLFHVFVCDKRLKPLTRFAFPYSLFGVGEPSWVDIDVPATKVGRDFYLVVCFDPTATRGVYVGQWKEKRSASLTGFPGKRGKKLARGLGWMIKARFSKSKGKHPLAPAGGGESNGDGGPDAEQLAAIDEQLDAAERREDVKAANAIIDKWAKSWRDASAELGRFDESEHFLLRRVGMPEGYAQALLRLMECAHDSLTKRFGMKSVGAVPGKKIHLRVELRKGEDLTLFTSPSSKDYSLIVFKGEPERALKAPGHGGPHSVYGFCHELGHVLIGWQDSRHQWAHYLGSMILEDVHAKLGAKAWGDPYDYRKVEGMPRFEKEIAGAKPGLGSEHAIASLFHAVGERFGTEIYGKALPWIKSKRQGKPFHAVRLYTMADLRAALIALTGEESAVRELFGE